LETQTLETGGKAMINQVAHLQNSISMKYNFLKKQNQKPLVPKEEKDSKELPRFLNK